METGSVDVLELTRKLHGEPTLETAIHILQWELGDLTKSVIYARWHPGLSSPYLAEARKALSDLFFQLVVVAQLLGMTPDEAFSIGVEEVRDRIKEKVLGQGRFKFYEGDKEDSR